MSLTSQLALYSPSDLCELSNLSLAVIIYTRRLKYKGILVATGNRTHRWRLERLLFNLYTFNGIRIRYVETHVPLLELRMCRFWSKWSSDCVWTKRELYWRNWLVLMVSRISKAVMTMVVRVPNNFLYHFQVKASVAHGSRTSLLLGITDWPVHNREM